MKNFAGKRVRCLATGQIFLIVAQLGADLMGESLDGTRTPLYANRVIVLSRLSSLAGIVAAAINYCSSRIMALATGSSQSRHLAQED